METEVELTNSETLELISSSVNQSTDDMGPQNSNHKHDGLFLRSLLSDQLKQVPCEAIGPAPPPRSPPPPVPAPPAEPPPPHVPTSPPGPLLPPPRALHGGTYEATPSRSAPLQMRVRMCTVILIMGSALLSSEFATTIGSHYPIEFPLAVYLLLLYMTHTLIFLGIFFALV